MKNRKPTRISTARIALALPVLAWFAAVCQAGDAIPSPRTVAADICDYARSLLADGRANPLMNNNDLLNRMNSVQRTAQKVVDDDARDPAGMPAKSTALYTALIDAAYGVARLAARSGTMLEDRQTLALLETRLRARSAELGAVLLPLPAVASIGVTTPLRRAALAALDLAQTARADDALVGVRPHISLAAGIDTVERAATSILLGNDQDRREVATKLVALSSAILLTERVATNIVGRDYESAETRSKSADLAGSLRAIATRLGVRAPSPAEQARNATHWSWWEEVPVPVATPSQSPSYIPPNGFVPDAATAARIAEAVWIPIWGEAQIATEKPFKITLEGDVWTVKGKDLPPLTLGGVAEADISKIDGKILRVIHGQ